MKKNPLILNKSKDKNLGKRVSKSVDSLIVIKEVDIEDDNNIDNDDDDDIRSVNNNQSNTGRNKSSTTNSSIGNLLINFRYTKKPTESLALIQALTHVKDFMTDIQKGHILLRESKLLMESGDYKTSIEILNEGINLNPNPSLFNARATCYKVHLILSHFFIV